MFLLIHSHSHTYPLEKKQEHQEVAPYARHDHNEGTIVKRTIVNIPLGE